jgi:hypothetical protein
MGQSCGGKERRDPLRSLSPTMIETKTINRQFKKFQEGKLPGSCKLDAQWHF